MSPSVLFLVAVFPTIMVLVWIFDPHRKFSARLQKRSPMSDAEFVAQYFAGTDIPAHVAISVRRIFAEQTGFPADKLLADDDLTFHWNEVDGTPFFESLGREFDHEFTDAEISKVPL